MIVKHALKAITSTQKEMRRSQIMSVLMLVLENSPFSFVPSYEKPCEEATSKTALKMRLFACKVSYQKVSNGMNEKNSFLYFPMLPLLEFLSFP